MSLLQKHPQNDVVGEEFLDGCKEIKRDEDGAHVENASNTDLTPALRKEGQIGGGLPG
jgi:hypothetical protein